MVPVLVALTGRVGWARGLTNPGWAARDRQRLGSVPGTTIGWFTQADSLRFDAGMNHGEKITLGQMRSSGARGVLIYCSDFRCSHFTAMSADRWPDQVRLSDLEPKFVCQGCGKRGADVRPDYDWDGQTASSWWPVVMADCAAPPFSTVRPLLALGTILGSATWLRAGRLGKPRAETPVGIPRRATFDFAHLVFSA